MKALSLFAFIAAWVAVFGAQILDGGHPQSLFTHPGPLLLVFGGSLAAATFGSTFEDVKQSAIAFKIAFLGQKQASTTATIESIKSLAETARRDGLLGLESKVKEYDSDPFLTRGVELILDGVEPEELRDLLESDITALEDRHKNRARFFEMAGGYAPTIGIVGTVMGLVHVLESLDEPDKLGPAIGAAFLATLWGVASSNLIYLPVSYKLKRLTAQEVTQRELVVEGLVAVQVGKTPRQVVDRLRSYLSAKQRVALEKGTA